MLITATSVHVTAANTHTKSLKITTSLSRLLNAGSRRGGVNGGDRKRITNKRKKD